jgi:hypothetical protein
MVRDNPTWGEERIAHELWLKLGIHVSPRTVRAYWPARDPQSHRHSETWNTFVRNHARALRALFLREGKLSGILIDEVEEMPSSSAYQSRFGSLVRAYSIVGYTPNRDYAYIEINRALRRFHASHVEEIVSKLSAVGAIVDIIR